MSIIFPAKFSAAAPVWLFGAQLVKHWAICSAMHTSLIWCPMCCPENIHDMAACTIIS
ncbi:hypothetical protein [Serratia marcescens]|uniref:hypothetical protein n=1 Tax=Serratia marcescens TaxID=615 RepID=UPI0021BDEF20|nr:hypothetical protein [Serratia marcescens]